MTMNKRFGPWFENRKRQQLEGRNEKESIRSRDDPGHLSARSYDDRIKSNGFVNGLGSRGRVNGLTNGLSSRGRVNGFINGLTARGRVNGFINGLATRGRVNGFINGLSSNGRVNGLKNGRNGFYNGLVNGLDRKNGWVNGNGFINGFRMTRLQRGLRLRKRNFPLRVALILLLAATIILTPFYLISLMPDSAIKIDGYFFDWERAGYFSERELTSDPQIDIMEYSVVVWRNSIYCYIATAAPMFSGQEGAATAFYALFDMDDNESTGYAAEDIGADVMVEVIGWNGTVRSSIKRNFAEYANRNDFNGFMAGGPIRVMATDHQLEFAFSGVHIDDPLVRFFAKNGRGDEDASLYAVRCMTPALRASVDFVLPEVISPNSKEAVLNLELKGQRGDIEISSMNFERLGNATAFTIYLYDGSNLVGISNDATVELPQPITVKDGYGKSLSVFVETDESDIICSFGLGLNASGVVTNDGTVLVEEKQTLSKVAYIGEIPGEVFIDGAFADWKNGLIMLDGDNDVRFENGTIGEDESIDILEYGMYVGDENLAMYLSVDNHICNGTLLPKDIHLPVASAGLPSLESPELLGADIAAAIIDIDLNISTGLNMNGVVGGDYLVFIAGKKGEILLSELYEWDDEGNGSLWSLIDTPVPSAVDHYRMEFAFGISNLPLDTDDVAAVGFFMTDWKEGTDYSDSLFPLARWQSEWYMKAFGGILINEVGHFKNQVDWIELYNTGTQPISLTNWVIYDGRTIIYTFDEIILNPGDFLLIEDFDLGKIAKLRLVDDQGVLIDSVRSTERSKDVSWGRTGDPPYSKWKQLLPSPGELNQGQTEIPEFSSILMPILGVIVLAFALGKRKRRMKNGQQ